MSGIRSVISKLTIKTVVDTATGLMSLNIVRGRGIAANEFINFAGKERDMSFREKKKYIHRKKKITN